MRRLPKRQTDSRQGNLFPERDWKWFDDFSDLERRAFRGVAFGSMLGMGVSAPYSQAWARNTMYFIGRQWMTANVPASCAVITGVGE